MHPHHATARHAGIAIIVSAIASIAAVASDSMASGKDALSIMQSMIALQQSHQLVHIVAMACLGGLMFGYTVLAQQLGLRRTPVLLGLIAYGMGTLLMLIATVVDGFIGTDLAVMFAGKSPEAVKAGYWMIQAASNVVLIDIARVSWVLQSVAAVCWAIALQGERGYQRAVGVLGLVVGALPALAIVMVGANMTEMVVVGILLLQALWNIAAATVLLRSPSSRS
ncbi:MAG: hypothetical protein V4484_07455 [Pseudomonadota bacterium]